MQAGSPEFKLLSHQKQNKNKQENKIKPGGGGCLYLILPSLLSSALWVMLVQLSETAQHRE
jgi:hypothetical protein